MYQFHIVVLISMTAFDSELTLTTTTVIISTKTLYAASPSTTSLPSSPTLSTTLSQINLQPTTTLAGVTTVWPLIAYAFAATTVIFCFLSVILGGCLCYFCRRVHLSSKLQNSGNYSIEVCIIRMRQMFMINKTCKRDG